MFLRFRSGRTGGSSRGVLRRLRSEAGSALVSVVGIAAVTAVIVTGLVATTVFAVGHTTANRSAVDARGAAESGIDVSVLNIQGKVACNAAHGYKSTTAPFYETTVEYFDAASGGWFYACTKLPVTATQLKVTSVGKASSKGALNDSGDTRSIEAMFALAVPPPVYLDKAIFSGDNATLSTHLEVLRDPANPSVPADIYAGKNYDCSTYGKVDGSVFVKGDYNNRTDCSNTGDLYVQGNMVCHTTMTIGGNAYVQGWADWTDAGCKVTKNLMVGDWFKSSNAIQVGGNVMVKGKYTTTNLPLIAGNIHSETEFSGNGANLFRAASPSRVFVPSSVGTIPNFDVSMDRDFPRFDQAWIDSNWSTAKGWKYPGWKDTFKALQKASSHDYFCSMDGGAGFNTLTITQPTVLDSRPACGTTTKIGGGLTIELKADLVILATNLHKAGDLTIKSGDGKEHGIYFMVPWTTGATTCDASGTNMVFSWGKYEQPDNLTRALFYAPKGFKIESADTKIRGQIYACQVNLAERMDIIFAPLGGLGDVDKTPTATLEYLRDLSAG